MLLYTGFALVLIGMILFICFHWRANTWLVLANLPFSLIGAVAAIALTGGGLSVGAMVGLVTVFGVSARNAILLLAHYEHLVEVEGAPWNAETVLRGAQERLVPILMTAAVTALGLMPLAIGMNQPGQEIEGPMAVTVLGGLFSSTLLNLVVLPALAERFGGPKPRRGGMMRRMLLAWHRPWRWVPAAIRRRQPCRRAMCPPLSSRRRPAMRRSGRRRLVERLWRSAADGADRHGANATIWISPRPRRACARPMRGRGRPAPPCCPP